MASMVQLLSFKQKTRIEETLVDDDYLSELTTLSREITSHCIDAQNEATVVNVFDVQLFIFLRKHFGLDYYPSKEESVNTVRHVAKGKIDSKIGALVIEYKQPSKLYTSSDVAKATQQLKEYLEGLYAQHEADYIGLITDGVNAKLVEMHLGKITEGNLAVLQSFHLDKIIKSIVLLDRLALTPENLIDNFCKPSTNSLVKKIVSELFDKLQNRPTERTMMLFQEWKELFKLAHDDTSKQQAIIERSEALAQAIGRELKSNDEEYKALYSIQTAYAIIVKIIAYKVACNAKFNDKFFEFGAYASIKSSMLCSVMQRLEDGAVFRDIGIGNLLEGDFFSWYSETLQWDDGIADCVKEVFQVLSRYEDIAIFGSKNNAQDLFRELYLQIMPDKVRHSLGEFYTPTWLAEHVVSRAIEMQENVEWSGLDPCAGSGTFINVMIQKVLNETTNLSEEKRLGAVLDRVKGIDLNPLAVLTARVNYFINISGLLSKDVSINIPVYLGDASYVPELIGENDTYFYQYSIKTLKKELQIRIPRSVISQPGAFSDAMNSIEQYIKNLDPSSIVETLTALVPHDEKEIPVVKQSLTRLAEDFVDLERNNWNGIWARIVTNFLTTASLHRVDIIVGNPPWIDWKTLPAGYRERIKGLCVARHLFSGDRITGGINLNICALISNVAAQNWLKEDGIMAFLMPKPLLFQQSYEGFRNLYLDDGSRMYFEEIHDWTKAGHPFKPVQQEFLTYFMSHKEQDYLKGIPVVNFQKKAGQVLVKHAKATSFDELANIFNVVRSVAAQSNPSITAFSYATSANEQERFVRLAGISDYKGREGIEFYPQELFLLEPISQHDDTVLLKNYQNQRSKHKIPAERIVLEKSFLRPLIKGVNIERFHISSPKYIVPFPYDSSDKRLPIELSKLTEKSPRLARYLTRYKSVMEAQTSYNDRIIGKKKAEFYALARVGAYTFEPYHVAFRDNTKWQAAVVSAEDQWFGLKQPVFQNHAVSISQRPDGSSLSTMEAHYICAVMNAPIVQAFIKQSSDSRTFKIRPPFKIPVYESTSVQNSLANLSLEAHRVYDNTDRMKVIDEELDRLYISLTSQ